jgi:hypothetical protein
MNDFTKQLKDNLEKKSTPLSGQEQDALWDSIATQLDVSGQEQDALWESIANQLDADDLKANHMKTRRRIAGYTSVAIIVAYLGWFLYPNTELPIDAKEIQKQAHASDVSTSEALSKTLTQGTSFIGETPALSANSDGIFESTSDGVFDAAANETQKSSVAEPPAIVGNERLAIHASVASTKDYSTSYSEENTEFDTELTSMDLLRFMDLKNPPESLQQPVAELAPMAPSYDEKSSGNEGPDRSFNLRMFQGPTWSKFSYLEQDGINLLAQNDNMKSDGSWSVGGMIEFNALQQNWGVGIEWNEFIHQLNYQGTFEQFNIIDDVLLQVEVDPNSGDTLNSVIGSAEVLVLVQRRVVHHNRLRTVTIPLEWQKQWSFTPILHGGIAFGALVHWRTLITGLTFTEKEGDFVNYSDSEFPSNLIYVAPMFRMHSTYDIAPDLSIELSARISSMKYSSSQTSDLPDQIGQFNGRLLTGNLSFGVTRVIQYKRKKLRNRL